MRNLAEEHENEEDEEFKEDTSEINDTNEPKTSKSKTEEAVISDKLRFFHLVRSLLVN